MDIHLQNSHTCTEIAKHVHTHTCTHTTISTHDVSIGKGRNENALLWWCWSEKPCHIIKKKKSIFKSHTGSSHSLTITITITIHLPIYHLSIHTSSIWAHIHPATITLVNSHHLTRRCPTQLNLYITGGGENTTDTLLRGKRRCRAKPNLCHNNNT